MQCGALILCFAAPAPVIDDSYHVCRPPIDFFSLSFAGEREKVAALSFLYFNQWARFKSGSVFSQIPSGEPCQSSGAFKSNFTHMPPLWCREWAWIIWLPLRRRALCFFIRFLWNCFHCESRKKIKDAEGVILIKLKFSRHPIIFHNSFRSF